VVLGAEAVDVTSVPACVPSGDRSTYWFTADPWSGGTRPETAVDLSYRSYDITEPSKVPPDGLVVLADGDITWFCGEGAARVQLPMTCPGDEVLSVLAYSPACWDGVQLDTPDHRGHLAYEGVDGCPPTHPVRIPAMRLSVTYFPGDDGGATTGGVSDRTVEAFTFGALLRWDREVLERLVAECINAGFVCDAVGQGEY
jgi:hypothetical protein